MASEEVLVCGWGNNIYGQLGIPRNPLDEDDDDFIKKALTVDAFKGYHEVIHVSCGWNHTLFLLKNRSVFACGLNDYGQCGQTSNDICYVPEKISALETQSVKSISCGETHSIVVSKSNQLFSFGQNDKGQLGLGEGYPFSKVPRQIKAFPTATAITSVSCGKCHSVALSTGGLVFAWGCNDFGQLGIGKKSEKVLTPILVAGLRNCPIYKIAAGACHTMALTVSGSLYGWGKNKFGQLGLGDDKDRVMPTFVSMLAGKHVRHMCCGEEHTVVLTDQHRVFTFGAGTSGQLGHGSFSDEWNPKMIIDLMGTDVTQIACGRKHTLVYTGKFGRLCSFGIGVKGQLGIDNTEKHNSPVTALGMWGAPSSELIRQSLKTFHSHSHYYSPIDYETITLDIFSDNSKTISEMNCNCYVQEIFAGGLQSCCIIVKFTKSFLPIYHSALKVDTLKFLNDEKVEKILNVFKNTDSSEIARFSQLLKTIFSNAACLNASFLKRLDHEDITSTGKHGIQLLTARSHLSSLSSNEEIKKIMLSCVKNVLLPSLMEQPFHFESMRVFLLVPEISFFNDMNEKWNLIIPYITCIQRLSSEAFKVLRHWWSYAPPSLFLRLVKSLKGCVISLLEEKLTDQPHQFMFSLHDALNTCMWLLEHLSVLNEQMDNIIEYQSFYLENIMQKIDLKQDYLNWIQKPNVFSFCKYPFVLNAQAKTVLLQIDASIQMKLVVNETNVYNIAGLVQGTLHEPVDPFLVLRVRRDNLLQDTLTEILKHRPIDYKKPLKVKFIGEEAEDAGGVRKEFFLLLMRELIDPKYGMFRIYEEAQVAWFNPNTFESTDMFSLIGIICGLAIYNATIIELPFPLCLYKKLLHKKVNFDDLRNVEPDVARNLQYMLDYPEDDFDEVFGLNFQVTESFLGQTKTIDLVIDGADTAVTKENRELYVSMYTEYKLVKSVSKQYEAFAEGFYRVYSGRVLNFFQAQELMEMVVGCNDFDLNDLEKIADYKGEYYRNHPVIINFWNVFHSLTLDMKKKFLAFLTGSSKVPILGIKSMQFIIQPVEGGEHGEHLPVAHTCFNLLDLPRYPTVEMMTTKLSQAIENYEGFGLV